MLATSTDLYAGKDPRDAPVYGPREAAACLNIPESTLLRWTTGHLGVAPVLTVERGQRRLSFFNLLEAFVLDDLRRRSQFSLQELRHTRIADAPLVNVSARGRNLVLTEVLRDFLKRVEKRPVEGIVRLYPFITKDRNPDGPKTVAVDQTVAFGKPVIDGTGIPTAAVYQLFNAGDGIREIAEEYDRDPSEIEAAIRYESVRAKRAA